MHKTIKNGEKIRIFLDFSQRVCYNYTEEIAGGKNVMEPVYHFNRQNFLHPYEFGEVRIFQIGRAFCHRTSVVNTHIQGGLFELTIVTGGRGIVTINGTPVPVEKNDIHLALPHDAHKIESDKNDPLKFDFIAFHTDNPTFRKELLNIERDYRPAGKRIIHDERIPTLIGYAIDEFSTEKIYSQELLSALFYELLVYLVRDFQNITPENTTKQIRNADTLCMQIMTYIDNHIFTMKNLEEIAPAMGYCYSYLSSLFKKTTTMTMLRYFQDKKLDVAKILVLEGEYKILEISEKLNYSTPYAFSNAFSAKYGCSPRAYRKKYGTKKES